jgi:CspA family cold shock protein
VKYAEGQYMETAGAVARVLIQRSVDPNEVASTLATLRELESGPQFFRFLDTVVQEGQAVVRSGRTLDYYRHIRDVCREHLMPFQDEPKKMAYILGWAVRLMRYYRVEGQPTKKITPARKQPAVTPAGERQSGQVKFFREDSGYGFITPQGGGKDVFVHKSQLTGGLTALSSGQRVTYEVGQGRKGPEARDVRPA